MLLLRFAVVLSIFCTRYTLVTGSATNNTTYCVTITGESYCGISEGWTPRISEAGGWVAVVIPTMYALVMLIVITYWRNKTDDDISTWNDIKNIFTTNRRLIYKEGPV